MRTSNTIQLIVAMVLGVLFNNMEIMLLTFMALRIIDVLEVLDEIQTRNGG